jgi:hypothetical protein
MNETPGSKTDPEQRASAWASPASRLKVSATPSGAVNLNVDGRQLTGPIQGFGQMWQKTYSVRLSGARVSPLEVIRVWKARFPEFWPKGNRMYPSLSGIAPGETALINANGPVNIPVISTGVMVIYADDVSFTFMTPEGHPFAGLITFSSYDEDNTTVAQVQVLIRANDPIYELGFRFGPGRRMEDVIWNHTMKTLASNFGVDAFVKQEVVLIDPKVQWSQAKNIWRNAGIRTALYIFTSPVRWMRNLFKRQDTTIKA